MLKDPKRDIICYQYTTTQNYILYFDLLVHQEDKMLLIMITIIMTGSKL